MEEEKKNFLQTKINYCVIVRADIGEIQQIKELLSKMGTDIIYQKIVPLDSRLIVKEAKA